MYIIAYDVLNCDLSWYLVLLLSTSWTVDNVPKDTGLDTDIYTVRVLSYSLKENKEGRVIFGIMNLLYVQEESVVVELKSVPNPRKP